MDSWSRATGSSTATTSTNPYVAAPPLYMNYKARWASVTDQRPLTWSTPDLGYKYRTLNTPTLRTRVGPAFSRIRPSPSQVEKRGVTSSGGGAFTVTVDGTAVTMTWATADTITFA